ncbi:MAG TPA: hypothetical protein EYG92_04575 [Lutibacter sp.]|nr:hypothetical protein [Lutibacter sp.]
MRNYLFLFIFIIGIQFKGVAQSGLSFEMHYPLIFTYQNDSFNGNDALVNRNNEGVLGGNFQYQFSDNVEYNYGISYQFETFQEARITQNTNAKKTFFLMSHINLFGKILFIDVPKLQAIVSGGFTTYKKGGQKSNLGYNFGGGFQYDIFNEIYFLTTYHYAQAKLKHNVDYSSDPEYHHIIRFGLGFRL